MILLLLALFLLPTGAVAASIFNIPESDLSRIFLSRIFGQVENALEMGDNYLLKGILVDFNAAVLTLGGIVILYSLVVSTINTSHEGEALGKNWNSVWIPMRAAAGFALLLPVQAKSYALIQVFVMWVIVQGIGAADFLWSRGVDSLQVGAVAINPDAASTSGISTSSSVIFTSQVCMREAARMSEGTKRQIGGPVGEGEDPGASPNSGQLSFGVDNLSPEDICGSVEYNPPGVKHASSINSAIDSMVATLSSAADVFVAGYPTFPNGTTEIGGKIKSAQDNYIVQVSAAYAGARQSGEDQDVDKALEYLKNTGWIMAGSYYLNLSQMSNDEIGKTIKGPSTSGFNRDKLAKQLTESEYNELMIELEKAAEVAKDDVVSLSDPDDIEDFLDENGMGMITKLFLGVLSLFQGWVFGNASTAPWAPLESLFDDGIVSPLLAIQATGIYMLTVAVDLWIAFVVAMATLASVAFGAGDSLLGLIGASFAKGIWISVFFSIITPVQVFFGIIFGVALSWAFYIPMIPYVIFTLAAIGWIILVIEAMAAGPLLAIGVLHPEGQHAVFGHSNQGLMILVGVFLRPSLMIVGLFASIMLSYIVVSYISLGYMPVVVMSMTHTNLDWGDVAVMAASAVAAIMTAGFSLVLSAAYYGGELLVGVITITTLLVIYTILVLIALNKSFSLIHHIPDRIMRWVGQAAEQSGFDKELQQLEGGVGETGKGMGQVSDKMQSAEKEKVSAGIQQGEKRRAESASMGAGGGGAPGGGGT